MCRFGLSEAMRAASRIFLPEIQNMLECVSASGSLPVTRKSSGITFAP